MKSFIFYNILTYCYIIATAQNTVNNQMYHNGIQMINTAQSEAAFLSAAALFKKISVEDETFWLSHYYTGLSYTLASHHNTILNKKDSLINLAQKEIDKALSLNPDEPEILILQALAYQASIMADPETRGMSYSMKANSVLQKALKKEPENPRAHLLIAYNIYYTPIKFGGGPIQALPKFIAAREKFEVFTPESAIHPQWGKKDADDLISVCQQ